MQFDSEKPDKITRGACNDDRVSFENPLNWTTRSFLFAKQREYENGPATPEPSGETIVRGRDRGKRKEEELYTPDPSYRKGELLAQHKLRIPLRTGTTSQAPMR